MLKVNNGFVEFPDGLSADILLNDVESVITAFIKISKSAEAPDEVIEKTLISMINSGFKHECIEYFSKKEGGEIDTDHNFCNGDNT